MLENTYIGPNQDVLAEYYSCASTFANNTVSSVEKRVTNECGASCTTNCYTPSGGGPDPNDCQVIADALLFEGQNTGECYAAGLRREGFPLILLSWNRPVVHDWKGKQRDNELRQAAVLDL